MTSSVYTTYFWIQDKSGNTNAFTVSAVSTSANAPSFEVFYSTDLNIWTSLGTTSPSVISHTFSGNTKVYLKAETNRWGLADSSQSLFGSTRVYANKNFAVGGNIMSLIYGDQFVGEKTFPDDTIPGIFNGLFYNQTKLVDAEELVLPVTHSTSQSGLDRVYRSMFEGCSNLVNGPMIDLRARNSNDCPYSLNLMFKNCTSLTTIRTCLQSDNYRYNNTFAGITSTGTVYNYSGTDLVYDEGNRNLPQNWNQVNIISMYLPTYDRVVDWYSSLNGRIYQVADNNNDIIYKKEIVTPDDLKYLADTYDPSYPSSAHDVVIKNITDFPATITLTTRATTKLSQDNTYTYGFTYYDNSGTSHQLTFSIDNLSYDINIAPGEVISANFVPYSTNPSDLLGYTPPLALSSTQYIVLLGGGSSVNERIPFQFDNSSKIVDASQFEWTINNTIVMSDETTQGNFMNLFSGSSHLVYPAKLNWNANTVENYQYLYGSTYQNCTNLRHVETIKVPSSGYNFRMCYRTYQGCTRLTNVDNAFVFQAAVFGGQPYVNNYASRSIAYSGNVSGYGIITQILDRTCYQTFSGCTGITSAKFSLPWAMCWRSNNLQTQYSYYQMFNDCTSLVEPPKLERVYCADGGDYNRGFLKGAYNGIFRNCTSLNKLVLVAGNTTRWYCPDYEYSFVGGSWTQSTNKTNLDEWLNPAQSGTIYYEGYQPQSIGTPSDGYLPNWTFTTNDWF